YAGLDEAFALANGTEYGLQAGIYTASLDVALKAAEKLRFGGVTINETPTFRVDQMPYGGTKESGNTREGPHYTVRAMTEERMIVGSTTGYMNALTALSGLATHVLQTNGYFPAHICQGPDGNIWSFGGTGSDDQSQPNPGDTLRRFDIEKGQISSYLPRATFPKYPVPEEMAYIHCSIDGVVVYSSKARKYIEMKYQGDQPHIYQVAQVPTGLRLSGFAQTGPKRIYGHFYRSGNNGLYYLSFDEAAKTVNWVPVEGTVGIYSKPGVIRGLCGADAATLLVNRAEDAASDVAVHWVTPP